MGNEAIAWIRYQWTSKIENREYLEHYVIPLNQRNLDLINQYTNYQLTVLVLND